MEFKRITSIDDPLFAEVHRLIGQVFPAEEVLAFEAWREPLQDASIRVCVALHEGEVVGATEYRYMPNLPVAMADFTIIARDGLGVGPFLWRHREADILRMSVAAGRPMLGMFAEIYNPALVTEHSFAGVAAMHPAVRREVLAHLGFKRLDFPYIHPSWADDGAPVTNLDLCFLPVDPDTEEIAANLVADFLKSYYAVLPNKPKPWFDMVERLRNEETIALRPL